MDITWNFNQWPPTNEDVFVLFEVSPANSVSPDPRLYEGRVQKLYRGLVFFPKNDINPLHPHFYPIAWRYVDAYRS